MSVFKLSVGQGRNGLCFLVNNVEMPVLCVVIGLTYTFDQSDESNQSYPCALFVGKSIWKSCSVDCPATPGAHFDLHVTDDTPSTLVYGQVDMQDMGGKVVVLDACTHLQHQHMRSVSVDSLTLTGHPVPRPAPGLLQCSSGSLLWQPYTLTAKYMYGKLTLTNGQVTCCVNLPTGMQSCNDRSTVFDGTLRATAITTKEISADSIRLCGHSIPVPDRSGPLHYDPTNGLSWGNVSPSFSSGIWLWRMWDFGLSSTVSARRYGNELCVERITDSLSSLRALSPITSPKWTADRCGRMCAEFEGSSVLRYDGPRLALDQSWCVFTVSMPVHGMCRDGPSLVLGGTHDLNVLDVRDCQVYTMFNGVEMPWPSCKGGWDIRCLTYTADSRSTCIVQHTEESTADYTVPGECSFDTLEVRASIGRLAMLLVAQYVPSREEILAMIHELSKIWNLNRDILVGKGHITVEDTNPDHVRRQVATELNVDESLVSVSCIHP